MLPVCSIMTAPTTTLWQFILLLLLMFASIDVLIIIQYLNHRVQAVLDFFFSRKFSLISLWYGKLSFHMCALWVCTANALSILYIIYKERYINCMCLCGIRLMVMQYIESTYMYVCVVNLVWCIYIYYNTAHHHDPKWIDFASLICFSSQLCMCFLWVVLLSSSSLYFISYFFFAIFCWGFTCFFSAGIQAENWFK